MQFSFSIYSQRTNYPRVQRVHRIQYNRIQFNTFITKTDKWILNLYISITRVNVGSK